MGRRLTLLSIALALAPAAPAAAQQTASPRGTWVGTAENGSVRVRYAITSLRVGRVVGSTRYVSGGLTCRGRLTLRARERGGYVFRDNVVPGSGEGCTTGDRIFVRRSGSRLSVRLTVAGRGTNVVRFTLRRA